MNTTPYSIEASPWVEGAIEYLYTVNISGETISTTVTQHPDAVTRWINLVNAHRINGVRNVGIEFVFEGNNNRVNNVRTGTMQLYVDGRCLVFYVPAGPLHPALDEFLANPNNRFYGINIADKLEALRTVCYFKALPVCRNLQAAAPADFSDIHVLYACTDVFIKTGNHL